MFDEKKNDISKVNSIDHPGDGKNDQYVEIKRQLFEKGYNIVTTGNEYSFDQMNGYSLINIASDVCPVAKLNFEIIGIVEKDEKNINNNFLYLILLLL